MAKTEKIRQQDVTELKTQLREAEEQLFRFRFQFNMGQLEGLKKYRQLRKDRARVLTELRGRELAAGSDAAGKGN
ncbi:MAG: 50S ribosomal protein L29 [Acidobacteria bacterium]|nr:50S ribosomal protein L29 [Acidobacteriota bacterium]